MGRVLPLALHSWSPSCKPGLSSCPCQVAGVLVLGRATGNSILHSQKSLGVWCWFFKEVPPSPEGHRQPFLTPTTSEPLQSSGAAQTQSSVGKMLGEPDVSCSAGPSQVLAFFSHMPSWSKLTPSAPLKVSPKEEGCHCRRREQAVSQEPWHPRRGLAGVSESGGH